MKVLTRMTPGIAVPIAVVLMLCSFGCQRSPQAQAALYMAAGIRRAESGDYARASLEFRNAAKKQPEDAQPHYRLALCYLELDDPAGAIASLQRALQLRPDYVEAQLKLSEILVATRRPEALRLAADRLNGLLSNHPAHPAALEMRAQAEIALGKLDDAERTLAQVPGGDKRGNAVRLMALIQVGRKNYAAAEQLLLDHAQREPDSGRAALVLGRLYRIMGRPADAEAQFRKALASRDSESQALLELAAMRMEGGRRWEAREFFEKLGRLPQPRYKLAWVRFLAEDGDAARAMKLLKQLSEQFPSDRAVRNALVRSYIAQGHTAEAQRILDRVLSANRADADALGERAELNLRRGKLREAHDDLMSVLQNRPESGEAHYLLAQVYRERGLHALEKRELSEALRLNQYLLQARIALAQILIRSKGARAALDLVNAAPAPQKHALPAVVERNWALLAMGERSAARESIDRTLAAVETADLALQDGLLKLAEGKPEAARVRLEPALVRWPADVRILDAVVAAYNAEKHEAKVLAFVQAHAAAHRQSIPVQEYLGRYLVSRGDTSGARAAFESVRAAGGRWKSVASLALARLAAREGDSARARELLTGLLASEPDNSSARRMLAVVEQVAGNHSKAIEHYRRLVAADNYDAVVLNNLAWLLSEHAGQPDLALRYAQRAREITPEAAPAIDDTLGHIYYHKGLYRTAIGYLESGVKKEPTAQRAYHLALAYLKTGQSARAQRTYRTARRLDPALPALE